MPMLVVAALLFPIAAIQANDVENIPFDQPILLAAVLLEPVQRDVAVTQEQTKQLAALNEQFQKQEVARADLDEKLENILDKDQFGRLQQISWQLRPYEALRSETVSSKLGIEDKQDALQKIWDDFQQKLVADLRRIRFKTPQDRQEFIRKRLDVVSNEMLNMLTAEQREKFHELLGEPLQASKNK